MATQTVPDLSEERRLYQQGWQYIAGLDEAGRGAWAGPLVAGAVVLPLNRQLELDAALAELQEQFRGVNDSKKLSANQRQKLFELISTNAYTSVGIVTSLTVDLIGVGVANRLAWKRAVQNLPPACYPDFLLLDAFKLPELPLSQHAIIKGDEKSLSIAAASIVAKVTRDRLMNLLELEYPGYGLAAHKGYGTAQHAAALERLGPSPVHRHSYRPVWQAFCQSLPQTLTVKVALNAAEED